MMKTKTSQNQTVTRHIKHGLSVAVIAASACLLFTSCSGSGETWTFNPVNGTLAHSRSAWILTARQDGANLIVTGVHNAPKKPSALPLDAKIKDNYKITHISGIFGDCDAIKSIKFPDSVTDIKLGDAFRDCPNLVSFSMSKNNPYYKSIGGVLFDKAATTLERYPPGKQGAYSIPNGVIRIARDAFDDCTGLTSVTISSSVTHIGERAFADCSGLKSVTISDGVTTISQMAFAGCTALTSVTIPSSVTHIGERAFADCSDLTDVVIPDGVTSIGAAAFYRSTGLKRVTIPDSVTSIGDNAFYGCTGLTSVSIPAGTTLGKEAFPVKRTEGGRVPRGASSHTVEVTRRPGGNASSK